MKQNTADLLIKCLETEGVERIYGIPGEETLDLMNAIEKSKKIDFIPVRHEQGAAFMADVYGRLTGKAGVCLSTLGPGATNLVTGIADANMDGAPVIAICGQAGTDRMHLTSHQFVDLVKLFEPITKRAKQIVRPESAPEIASICFKYAENYKPGAAAIILPQDVAAMEADGAPLKRHVLEEKFASRDEIALGVEIIKEAKKPLILVGSNAVRNHAEDVLTEFAESLHIPVVNTMMSKGMIPFTSKYSLWTLGIPWKDYVNVAFNECDLVISIGYDFFEFAPQKWNPNGDKKIVHIDTEESHISKCYQSNCQIVGNISGTLRKIMEKVQPFSEPEWAFKIKKMIEDEHYSYENDYSFPIKPQKLLLDVRKVMGEDDILLSDVGAHKMWIGRHYNCYKPNTCIVSNGFATMGISVPGAISAKMLYPERKVLAICGDGGFMMNSQELETAKRCGVPIVVLLLNDSAYGLIKWKQDDKFKHHCYVDFTNPDYVKYAEAMGCKGYRVERCEDLIPTLIEAFKQDVPCVIDCPVDYSENVKLSERLKEYIPSLMK